jgi:hypothetical protein
MAMSAPIAIASCVNLADLLSPSPTRSGRWTAAQEWTGTHSAPCNSLKATTSTSTAFARHCGTRISYPTQLAMLDPSGAFTVEWWNDIYPTLRAWRATRPCRRAPIQAVMEVARPASRQPCGGARFNLPHRLRARRLGGHGGQATAPRKKSNTLPADAAFLREGHALRLSISSANHAMRRTGAQAELD